MRAQELHESHAGEDVERSPARGERGVAVVARDPLQHVARTGEQLLVGGGVGERVRQQTQLATAADLEARLRVQVSRFRREEGPEDVHPAHDVIGDDAEQDDVRPEGAALALEAQHGLVDAVAAHAEVQHLEVAARGLHACGPGLRVGHLVAAHEGIAERRDAHRSRRRRDGVVAPAADPALVEAHAGGGIVAARSRDPAEVGVDANVVGPVVLDQRAKAGFLRRAQQRGVRAVARTAAPREERGRKPRGAFEGDERDEKERDAAPESSPQFSPPRYCGGR